MLVSGLVHLKSGEVLAVDDDSGVCEIRPGGKPRLLFPLDDGEGITADDEGRNVYVVEERERRVRRLEVTRDREGVLALRDTKELAPAPHPQRQGQLRLGGRELPVEAPRRRRSRLPRVRARRLPRRDRHLRASRPRRGPHPQPSEDGESPAARPRRRRGGPADGAPLRRERPVSHPRRVRDRPRGPGDRAGDCSTRSSSRPSRASSSRSRRSANPRPSISTARAASGSASTTRRRTLRRGAALVIELTRGRDHRGRGRPRSARLALREDDPSDLPDVVSAPTIKVCGPAGTPRISRGPSPASNRSASRYTTAGSVRAGGVADREADAARRERRGPGGLAPVEGDEHRQVPFGGHREGRGVRAEHDRGVAILAGLDRRPPPGRLDGGEPRRHAAPVRVAHADAPLHGPREHDRPEVDDAPRRRGQLDVEGVDRAAGGPHPEPRPAGEVERERPRARRALRFRDLRPVGAEVRLRLRDLPGLVAREHSDRRRRGRPPRGLPLVAELRADRNDVLRHPDSRVRIRTPASPFGGSQTASRSAMASGPWPGIWSHTFSCQTSRGMSSTRRDGLIGRRRTGRSSGAGKPGGGGQAKELREPAPHLDPIRPGRHGEPADRRETGAGVQGGAARGEPVRQAGQGDGAAGGRLNLHGVPWLALREGRRAARPEDDPKRDVLGELGDGERRPLGPRGPRVVDEDRLALGHAAQGKPPVGVRFLRRPARVTRRAHDGAGHRAAVLVEDHAPRRAAGAGANGGRGPADEVIGEVVRARVDALRPDPELRRERVAFGRKSARTARPARSVTAVRTAGLCGQQGKSSTSAPASGRPNGSRTRTSRSGAGSRTISSGRHSGFGKRQPDPKPGASATRWMAPPSSMSKATFANPCSSAVARARSGGRTAIGEVSSS